MRHSNEVPTIEWQYEGKPDYVIGTQATPAERALALGASLFVPMVLLLLLLTKRLEIAGGGGGLVLALVLAFDVGGGVVCNSLNSLKRMYHSPVSPQEGPLGKAVKNKLLFASFHIHSILVWGFLAPAQVTTGILWYVLLLGASVLVWAPPLYLKRPVSMLLIMGAILVNAYGLVPVVGFEWLMPLLFLKIVYGQLVREEPYRKSATPL
ncbi:MAG: hypothetical protein ACRDBX_01815 [Erysipelotrichaceae bacterium]